MDCRPPSLEEIFLRHYGEDPRAAELLAALQRDSDDEADGRDDAVARDADGAGATAASGHAAGSDNKDNGADNGAAEKVPS